MSLNLEKTVKDWIDTDPNGDGLTAYLEVPADRPKRFVTIERVGGSVATGGNAPPASRTVTVRAGDTLSDIAARLGISYTQLTGYRSGNPNVIYPGEVLHY